jgi:hypothetical protein
VLAKTAALEWLIGRWQAQRGDVPADQLGAGRQVQAEAVFSHAAAVADGFERQPFQPGVLCQREPGALQRQVAFGAVKARGAGRGYQAVRPCAHVERQVQRVAAHQPAGRMDNHVVADAGAFRIQALQDAQRAAVAKVGDGFFRLSGVVKG